MLTTVEIVTPRITESPLDFDANGRAVTDLLQIRNIKGLEPVVATVNTSQYGSVDGEFYNGSTVGKRNIILTIGLNPDWGTYTYEILRRILYSYLMPKNPVTLTFESTHMETVSIDGYVESFDMDPFSKDPEIVVSILCPRAEFVGIGAKVITGTTYAIGDGDYDILTYPGNVPTGFVLEVSPITPNASDEIRVQFLDGQTVELFIANVNEQMTWFQRLSTVPGSKFLYQVPFIPDVPVNILGTVVPGSIWIQIQEGDNQFRIMSDDVGQPWTLSYFARYGGI